MNTLRRSTTLPLATLGLLVACAGNGPTPPPQGVTVSGSVRDRVAEPIGGATVLLGKSSVTSSSDGTFSIPGVVAPYDITVILSAQNTAVIALKPSTSSSLTVAAPCASFTPPV